jgi:hypothetical protein
MAGSRDSQRQSRRPATGTERTDESRRLAGGAREHRGRNSRQRGVAPQPRGAVASGGRAQNRCPDCRQRQGHVEPAGPRAWRDRRGSLERRLGEGSAGERRTRQREGGQDQSCVQQAPARGRSCMARHAHAEEKRAGARANGRPADSPALRHRQSADLRPAARRPAAKRRRAGDRPTSRSRGPRWPRPRTPAGGPAADRPPPAAA